MDEAIRIGVLRVGLSLPGARTLKDRRQVVQSLLDRVRARFRLSAAEVDGASHAGRAVLVFTTAGNDARIVRSTLDQVAALVARADAEAYDICVEVFPWTPGMPVQGGVDE